MSNLDANYQKQALAYNQARSAGLGVYYRGHFQGTGQAFKIGFKDAFPVGAGLGVISGVYYRQIMHIPRVAMGFGLANGLLMMTSQLYRFEM